MLSASENGRRRPRSRVKTGGNREGVFRAEVGFPTSWRAVAWILYLWLRCRVYRPVLPSPKCCSRGTKNELLHIFLSHPCRRVR